MIIDDSSDSSWILEIGSPRKKPVARMEACEADGDDGASVFEPGQGVYEPALLEDPSGGAVAHPSAKEVFDDLVREQCENKNVNCWTQAQVDTCITITIKILLLQLDASHETARRHPSSPRRKLKICPTPKVANKLPCGRSWQGATAPAARHKT